MERHSCNNCIYFVQGIPSVCNAFRTPSNNALELIECSEWEEKNPTAKESLTEILERHRAEVSERQRRLSFNSMNLGYYRMQQPEEKRRELSTRQQSISYDNGVTLAQLEQAKQQLPDPNRWDSVSTSDYLVEVIIPSRRPVRPLDEELPVDGVIATKMIRFTRYEYSNGWQWVYNGNVIM